MDREFPPATPGFKKFMIADANSGSINFKKTGKIRTRGVLSKKDEKKVLDFFLVLLPLS
jgi:hypothetical protein